MKNFKLKQNANALALGFFILFLVIWFFWDFEYKGTPVHQVNTTFLSEEGTPHGCGFGQYAFDGSMGVVMCYSEEKSDGIVGIYTTKPFPYTGYFKTASVEADLSQIHVFEVEDCDSVAVVSLNGQQVHQIIIDNDSSTVDFKSPFATVVSKGGTIQILDKDGNEVSVNYHVIENETEN